MEREAIAYARERLSAAYPQSGLDAIGGGEVFFDVSTPPPSLVVFGAGYDSVPLVKQAWTLGFAVTVVDVREAYLTADRFPGATLISAHFSRFAEAVTVDARSFALVMNHHIERDQRKLAVCPRLAGRLHRRARAAFALSEAPRRARRRKATCRILHGSRRFAARWAFHSAPRRQKRWRCRFSARSSQFGADSKADS